MANAENPVQLRLGGEFAPASSGKIEKAIENEIPSLRLVKKGQQISITTKRGYSTRVFLEEDLILQRLQSKKNRRKYVYIARIPILVKSVKYGNKWTVGQGEQIYTFSKKRRISKKQEPEIIQRIKNSDQRKLLISRPARTNRTRLSR